MSVTTDAAADTVSLVTAAVPTPAQGLGGVEGSGG